MDVRCDRCQTEYELDEHRLTEAGLAVKCTNCGNVFKVRRGTGAYPAFPNPVPSPQAPRAPTSASPQASTAAGPRPAVAGGSVPREWHVRRADGSVLTLRDLTELQRAVVERRVEPNDGVSLTGGNWRTLGSMPELVSFFAKARAAPRPAGATAGPAPVPPRPAPAWQAPPPSPASDLVRRTTAPVPVALPAPLGSPATPTGNSQLTGPTRRVITVADGLPLAPEPAQPAGRPVLEAATRLANRSLTQQPPAPARAPLAPMVQPAVPEPLPAAIEPRAEPSLPRSPTPMWGDGPSSFGALGGGQAAEPAWAAGLPQHPAGGLQQDDEELTELFEREDLQAIRAKRSGPLLLVALLLILAGGAAGAYFFQNQLLALVGWGPPPSPPTQMAALPAPGPAPSPAVVVPPPAPAVSAAHMAAPPAAAPPPAAPEPAAEPKAAAAAAPVVAVPPAGPASPPAAAPAMGPTPAASAQVSAKSPAAAPSPVPGVVSAIAAKPEAGQSATKAPAGAKSFDAYLAQGHRLLDSKPTAALTLFEKAAELDPASPEPDSGRGLAYANLERLGDAASAFQVALRKSPEFTEAIMGLAEVSRAQGKRREAMGLYQRYLDLTPDGPDAPAARAQLEQLKAEAPPPPARAAPAAAPAPRAPIDSPAPVAAEPAPASPEPAPAPAVPPATAAPAPEPAAPLAPPPVVVPDSTPAP